MNRREVVRRVSDDRIRWTNQLDPLHVFLSNGRKDRAITHHVLFPEMVSQLFPEEGLVIIFMTYGRETPTDYDFFIGDIHASDRSANAEKNITGLGYSPLCSTEKPICRESVSKITYSLVERLTLTNVIVKFRLWRLSHCEVTDIFKHLDLPTLGNGADWRRNKFHFFVAREAEVDEPLAVAGAGHLLQDPDAPLVVLDPLVIGRQDARDSALDGERRNSELKRKQLLNAQVILRSTAGHTLHLEFNSIDVVFYETNIRLLRVWNESNNTIRKAAGDAENRSLSYVGSNCDAESTRLPKFALRESFFVVGLRILHKLVVGSLDISGLEERIFTAV